MVYLQYFNQILTVVLEVLDDSDSLIRDLALSLIIEMLKNQVCFWYTFVYHPFYIYIYIYIFFFFSLRGISCLTTIFIFLHPPLLSFPLCDFMFPERCNGRFCWDSNWEAASCYEGYWFQGNLFCWNILVAVYLLSPSISYSILLRI